MLLYGADMVIQLADESLVGARIATQNPKVYWSPLFPLGI